MKRNIIMFIVCFVVCLSAIMLWDSAQAKPTETVYVICDVIETYADNGTHIICEMPNGELHDYMIIDEPLREVELVCFATETQDDYTSYRVVAVR